MTIKSLLAKIPFAKKIYKKYHIDERISFYKQRNQMKEFAEKGDSVIESVHKTLGQTGLMFFVDAGTLIGVYRDGRLLKRDMDVDMGIIVDSQDEIHKLRELLSSNGFKLTIKFRTPNAGYIQDAYDYNGVRVDLCYYFNQGPSTICYLLYGDDQIIKMSFSKISSIKKYQYKDQCVNIPEDSDKYLEERYGKTWRKPDPFFKYWEGPCVTPVEGRGICEFTEYYKED